MSIPVKAIIGLGNPGLKYRKTRHNIGFMVAESIVSQVGGSLKKGRDNYLLFQGRWKKMPLIIAEPLTYMNNSGQAVAHVVKYFDIQLENIIIIHDDVNLPFGRLRLREKGSEGGHNGLASIIQHLGTQHFPRLRIGVGNDYAHGEMAKYVLSRFTRDERRELPAIICKAADATLAFAEHGISAAMNQFN